MQLENVIWTKQTRKQFDEFLQSLSVEQKIEWAKNIINTNMRVLAISTPVLKKIIKKLCKSDIQSFLDFEQFAFYENTIIYSALITHLPFDKMAHHLQILAKVCDNWATCDTIPFKNIKEKDKLFELGVQYATKPLPFERRIGMKIMMEFASDTSKTQKIFDLLNQFENEQHYYVNMMNAWLVCEMFIKQKQATWQFLKNNKLNKFTQNKAISKCRDSFRVCLQEKQKLLSLKK